VKKYKNEKLYKNHFHLLPEFLSLNNEFVNTQHVNIQHTPKKRKIRSEKNMKLLINMIQAYNVAHDLQSRTS